jgi:hypothetical protein
MIFSGKLLSSVIRASSFVVFCLFSQCSQDELLLTSATNTATTSTGVSSLTTTSDCGCTYTVPANLSRIDGQKLGIKAGAVICLKAGTAYGPLVFTNIRGTSSAPITIKNCGGTAVVTGTGKWYGIRTELSSFIKISGGKVSGSYGIKINGGTQSLHIEGLTTDVEVDHVEILNSGFAGIMAKTDPSCNNATLRGNFVMRNVLLHDNYVHDTGGEGFYVGHTFYNGIQTDCGFRLPHLMENVKIYNNLIKNSGWESIQVGSTPTGADVYNNRIENFGVKNKLYQNNGVQFGEGAPGRFYGNYIKGGKGAGLMILGNGQNLVHDNVIINVATNGIFCDDRTATGTGFKFINNTIINPGQDGIRLYADNVPMNQIYNNIIVNPKSFSTYSYPRTGNDAYVYLLNKSVKLQTLNNIFTRDINSVKFAGVSTYNYRLNSGSPAVNKGTNISSYNITVDQALGPRLKGSAYDVGAYEY